MLSRINSFGLTGIEGYPVEVEADVNNGLPGIEIGGLPDTSVKEAKERVRSAIKNCGFMFTPKKITLNLAPADVRKAGSFYDLPIALGILAATGQLDHEKIGDTVFIGELALDGSLRRINGVLPIIISARDNGFKTIVIPKSGGVEARFIDGIDVYALGDLREVCEFIGDRNAFLPVDKAGVSGGEVSGSLSPEYIYDFKYVKGQVFAKRAMEVAAAGGHNILLIGPPGGGKTMISSCIPSILPDMTTDEMLETTKIHSVSGLLGDNGGIVSARPFRRPHHTSSRIALTGGGSNANPGEISLAHNGVLFLDELLEYPRSTLEILRQPLEDGVITVARAARTVTYPADFMLVASMNPCPCGNYGSSVNECTCTPANIAKYMSKLSGPLLDRIDLHVEVDNITYDDLVSDTTAEPSAVIRERVNKARKIQQQRYAGTSVKNNAGIGQADFKKYCALEKESEQIMKKAFEKLGLSARAYTRILKVARTIADLENCENIRREHLSEAIGYRSLDRGYWK